MRRYVIGLMFDTELQSVVLIRKRSNAPQHLAGKLNGPGGKIDENEDALTAMQREFHEETGVMTRRSQWRRVAKLFRVEKSECVVIYVFASADTTAVRNARTTTDEFVTVRSIPLTAGAHEMTVHLPMLLDEAMERLAGSNTFSVAITFP